MDEDTVYARVTLHNQVELALDYVRRTGAHFRLAISLMDAEARRVGWRDDEAQAKR